MVNHRSGTGIKKPARRPVFRNRRSGSKITKVITWQLVLEQQQEQQLVQRPEQQQERRQERQQQELEQQPGQQEQPGLLFCHKQKQQERSEQQPEVIVSFSSL